MAGQSSDIVPINVGVRFQPIGESEPNVENNTSMKHWVLVISPPSREFSFTYEVVPGKDDALHTSIMYYDGTHNAYPVGTYYGRWDDLIRVLEVHPQRGTIYSACFNNCQHFVAIYLTFLTSHAVYVPGRSWTVNSDSRYQWVTSVLNLQTSPGTQLWNSPNIFLATGSFMPIPVSGAVAFGAAVAANATVATTVTTIGSAGGIAGWLGATTTVTSTVIVPAAYVGLASACAPLAIIGTGITGLAYFYNKQSWKEKTIFKNPWISGFPRGRHPALTLLETSVPNPAEVNSRYLSSGSSSLTSSTSTAPTVPVVILARNRRARVQPAIGALGATALYQLASMVVEMMEMADVTMMDGYR